MAELTGKVALVGGASQGIGAAIASLYAESGAKVVLMSRSAERLEAVRKQLANPELHLVLSVDLEEFDKIPALLSPILTKLGPIEIVVNNSGGPASGPLVSAEVGDFEKAFGSHILASQTIMKAVLPGMREKNYGRIINIISTSVKQPIPNLGVSNTIRAAMANWSKTLATEVAPWGITVNNILPGYTQTPRLQALVEAAAKRENKTIAQIEAAWRESVPARRFAKPEEIAQAALYLASPRAGFVNGTQIVVDGGRTGSL